MQPASHPNELEKEETVEGFRFEKRGEGSYYKVLLHIGSTFVPISDKDVDELKKQSPIMGEKFVDFFLDRVGYSSYLKDQIRAELRKLGEAPKQISTLRQLIREL